MNIVDLVESQLLSSIKDEKDIDKAIAGNANIAFLLTGSLLTLQKHISRLQAGGMHVFLHLDFIDGISNSRSAVQYIARVFKPAGIITTKNSLIKYANEEGLLTIQRIFLIDRAAISKGVEVIKHCKPNAIEVLPGLMPRVIDQLTREVDLPVIAGGLISDKKEVLDALEAGALAVSSGDPALWNLDI